MSKKLQHLKEATLEYYKKWEAKGGKMTSYTCPHCNKEIPTNQPSKKDVGKKGYWDSSATCIECGNVSFLITHIDGKTKAIKM